MGSLVFDKIYTAKRCEFSQSNCQIYGMSNEQPIKTLLSMMFKRIASKYERVLGMVSLTKMDSSILLKLFNDVMNATTTTGYDIVTSLVDGHSSNVKFMKRSYVLVSPLHL